MINLLKNIFKKDPPQKENEQEVQLNKKENDITLHTNLSGLEILEPAEKNGDPINERISGKQITKKQENKYMKSKAKRKKKKLKLTAKRKKELTK
jgi:hypothetical protein